METHHYSNSFFARYIYIYIPSKKNKIVYIYVYIREKNESYYRNEWITFSSANCKAFPHGNYVDPQGPLRMILRVWVIGGSMLIDVYPCWFDKPQGEQKHRRNVSRLYPNLLRHVFARLVPERFERCSKYFQPLSLLVTLGRQSDQNFTRWRPTISWADLLH